MTSDLRIWNGEVARDIELSCKAHVHKRVSDRIGVIYLMLISGYDFLLFSPFCCTLCYQRLDLHIGKK